MYRQIINALKRGGDLSQRELVFFVEALLTVEEQKQVLAGLEDKGVTPVELVFLARHLRQQASLGIICPGALDICGTGGSGLPRLNTSTLSAWLLAALGVPIAKHGNKAGSGRFGSFDLLAGLDINIEPSLERMSYVYWREQLLFMYARQFYPIMKKFAAARAELGRPSVFNLLGPLLSPADPEIQLIGVSDRSKMELLARAAQLLGRKRTLVVRGEDGLDEVTLTGPTEVVEAHRGRIKRYFIRPADFGVAPARAQDILVGATEKNINLATTILRGRAQSRHRDLVLVNAALALYLAGRAGNYRQGYKQAAAALAQGLAYKKFESYRRIVNSQSILEEIAGHKYQEALNEPLPAGGVKVKKSDRSFLSALKKPGLSLVAEIKKASPSGGGIYKAGLFSPERIARVYQANGARAISVVTDKRYFQGESRYLTKARQAVKAPVLCKDFIIDSRQITAARRAGADAILLIAAILDDVRLKEYLAAARKLGMAAIVEVHNREELKRALGLGANILGINNRDLHTLKTDLKVTHDLARYVPDDILAVSESGIVNQEDVRRLPGRIDAILAGSSIMASGSPLEMAKKVRELSRAKKIFKACGIRTVAAARTCEEIGVDITGLNFVPTSKRCISLSLARRIRQELRRTKVAGVFMNQPLSYVRRVARTLALDYVQLSGNESIAYSAGCRYPVIKTILLSRPSDVARAKKYLTVKNIDFIIFDSRAPGSGQAANFRLLRGATFPYLIAGGVRAENVGAISKQIDPIGFDAASGLEDKSGQISLHKIKILKAAIVKL